jgi:hypothetical protein
MTPVLAIVIHSLPDGVHHNVELLWRVREILLTKRKDTTRKKKTGEKKRKKGEKRPKGPPPQPI